MVKKSNEVHVSKLITEMPKLDMSHNARLVLYTVLKKVWQTFRNRDDYESKYILLSEDLKKGQEPVTLNLADLRPLFSKNAHFEEIKDHILTIPYEALFKTYYDLHGKKTNELMDTKISLFNRVQVSKKNKTIKFIPSENLIIYVEALKTFAKIDIEEIKKLTSLYAIRGYELICQNNYLDNNNNKLVDDEIRKIRVDDLRRYFEVPDTYNIGRIDQRVFAPMIRMINKHTKYNIVEIKKFRLDPNHKNKVSHFRIDVEYKEEYLKELKEKIKTKKVQTNKSNIFDFEDTFKIMKEQARKEIMEDYKE